MRSITDDQFRAWCHGLNASNRRSYAELFETSYEALHRYARYITHDPEAADDVLQEVYGKLWEIRERLDPERSLRALMYQMVRNYALNHQRDRKRRATTSLDDSLHEPVVATSTDERVETAHLETLLRQWIDELPTRRREAFMLSRYEGLTHDEIAALMGLAPKTVNNHIVLALQHLRSRLDALEPTPLRS